MPFPLTYRQVRRITLETVLDVEMARAIARKAGARLTGGSGGGGPLIWGTFSEINDAEFGFLSEYLPAVDAYYFPDDSERMSRYADMQGLTQARLLVTVTQAGAAGSTLSVASDELAFEPGEVLAPLDSVGVHVSPWCNMTMTGEASAVLTRWVVHNPSVSAGTFGVGLCQLQVQ